MCVRTKTSHLIPAEVFHPLSVPQCLWSHIALAFVTGHPLSDGHMVLLTIVDLFSKVAHFVPLSKLPTVAETGEGEAHICLHGIPKDIVSGHFPGLAGLL